MYIILFILFISYTLLFLYSLKTRDNSIVDVFWGMGFMMIALLSYLQSEMMLLQTIMTLLVWLWWVRIVSHIWLRKLSTPKEDPRYAKWREEWGTGWYFYIRSFLQVYLLQMTLLFIVATPILIVNLWMTSTSSVWNVWSLTIVWILLSLGWLLFETIADMQLKEFLKIKKPGQIFTTWLYKYSRHPNYFGESVFWFGISLLALPVSLYAIIGWLMITTLLLFVSGVPMQEARYSGRPEWESYKSKTSVFVPWFPGK